MPEIDGVSYMIQYTFQLCIKNSWEIIAVKSSHSWLISLEYDHASL